MKFSPDKVDTMVVQAVALLDDLDKEINIYAMRVKVSLESFVCAIFTNLLVRNGTVGISLSSGKLLWTISRMRKLSKPWVCRTVTIIT